MLARKVARLANHWEFQAGLMPFQPRHVAKPASNAAFQGGSLAGQGCLTTRQVSLLIFAGLGFLNGIAQRIRRWWDLERNVRQHSYYIGSSPFDQRWLPTFSAAIAAPPACLTRSFAPPSAWRCCPFPAPLPCG